MKRVISKVRSVSAKSIVVLKDDGPKKFVQRSAKYVYYRQFPEKKQKKYRDILFINGCTLSHPTRYRVDHQIEQLESQGLTTDSVFYGQLNLEMLKYYRGFVFFRCPVTDTVREFITQAKQFNKTCFFDIDDLVIDQKYTDQIEYVKSLTGADRALYDDGVNRMRKTLELCDYAITSTECLQRELQHYTREVFVNRNVASDEMVATSLSALKTEKRQNGKIVIGYFSGSITHNENFDLVLPSLLRLLEKHPNLYLKIAGILDIPSELKPYQDRIIRIEFMDWRTMPKEIATCDITIAPLISTIFNEAKSENKWIEAALVGVVTVASNVGAFKATIKDGVTGVLVDNNEWYEALDKLILDPERREGIARNAHKIVLENHTTIATGNRLATFIRSKLARNIGFVLPSTDISGGVNVVLKHAEILQKHGWDVSLLDAIQLKTLKNSRKQYDYRLDLPGHNVITMAKTKMEAYFDTVVATLWATVEDVKQYPNTTNRLYFVQNYETDFYVRGAKDPRLLANATYSDATSLRYITMSLWCQQWLKEKFSKTSKYASNGIDLQYYPVRKRDFGSGKIHILIEGDSRSEYKNTDEAFRIVEQLDPKRYEISYLSYRKEPKNWYRVDHFYNRISPDKVGEIYAKCDILVKTSLLESFSYPPLEMMATGGVSVVVPNGGNREYLQDGVNCLFYKQGDIADGVSKIELLMNDKVLRDTLIKNGLATARKYQWDVIEEDILSLYK